VGRTLAWLGLSTCASVLLLASTNQLSQDVAAGPFLWVLPLALYLLTFILAFEREALYSRAFFGTLLALSVLGTILLSLKGASAPVPLQVLGHGLALFSGCMVCHGELYKLRPAPRHLSTFYLWVSVGGVVGGAFVSLLAPHIFRTYVEYPLALAACCLVALGVTLPRPEGERRPGRVLRVARVMLLALMLLGPAAMVMNGTQHTLLAERNFFGVVQVRESDEGTEQHAYTLRHGVIVHGFQLIHPERRKLPTAYYTRGSGLGLAIAEQRRLKQEASGAAGLRIGVLGLGVGTSAALAQAGDTVRFYEINPIVIALARGEGGYFAYLQDTPATVEVVEGDARIALEQEVARGQPQAFDVLALDVFSSDSIPMHLLTEEAMAVYQRHLAPRGVLALHVSNLHLDLVPMLLAHAERFGLHPTLVSVDKDEKSVGLSSKWMVLSPERDFTRGLAFSKSGSEVLPMGGLGLPRVTWTDDQSSVLSALKLLQRGPSAEELAAETQVAAPATP
jgi:SAM-dependent methyltransferase